jgi:hypothetical protein
MGNNYLNIGESIILSTHSVSVDESLYDVLLTNERIVLVDNRYTRFEPRTLPFTQIISVKGGRVPTGEPVITLVITESGSLEDSRDQHLIFTQHPGEERRHERDLWVKQLIELVVSARQHAVREETAPHEHEPGVKPSVRRWLAPDHLQPRTAPEKKQAPARVVVEPDEMDLPEFLFEESVPAGELPAEGPEGIRKNGVAQPAPVPVPFPVLTHIHKPGEIRLQDTKTETQPGIHGEEYPAYTGEPEYAEDLLADTGAGIVEARGMSGSGDDGTVQSELFSRTVFAAITSMHSARGRPEPAIPSGRSSEYEQGDQPVAPAAPAVEESISGFVDTPADAGQPEIVPTTPVPEITVEETGRDDISNVIPPAVNGVAEPILSEVPSAPHLSVITAAEPEPLFPPAKRALPAAALAVLAILILVVGVVLIAHFLPTTQETSSVAVITLPTTIPPTVAPVLKNTPETGVRVRVISPGPYFGTIGNPGYLRQVSGSGDTSYTVLKNDDIVSATLQKQDNSGSALTVEIYNNGTLLTSRTVTAPMGEIQLLIDPKTALPPGIAPATPSLSTTTGNATLTYL